MEPTEKGEQVLGNATIELSLNKYNSKVLQTTVSDVQGNFTFSNAAPGKYKLTISYPALKRFVQPIKLIKPVQKKAQKILLLVALGADFTKPCGGGYARLQKE